MNENSSSYARIARLNKAMGDPLRLQILRVLSQDAFGVLELCKIFDHKQSGMSHHLKVLSEVDLVSKRREGNSIFYSRQLPVDDGLWPAFQQSLFALLDSLGLPSETIQRVIEVKAERAAQSQTFFEQHADDFREHQDLISDISTYKATIVELLEKIAGPERPIVIEIGPGQGELLPDLDHLFKTVYALDNSPNMLARSKVFCERNNTSNIEFIGADTVHLRTGITVDCVVMNMVLHHTPSPAEIFEDIKCCLNPNAIVLITELCRHDQEWARSSCGDLWMGFDSSELNHWAQAVGLSNTHSHFFALRNGFQVQIQQFTWIQDQK